MSKLKTLHDIDFSDCEFYDEAGDGSMSAHVSDSMVEKLVRKEAIKHLKAESKDLPFKTIIPVDWIKWFFNITDKELE